MCSSDLAYKMPGYGMSLISLASICAILVFIKKCTTINNSPDHEGKSEAEEEDDPDVNFVSKSPPDNPSLGFGIGATAHSIGITDHSVPFPAQSSHSSSENVQTAIQVIQKKHAESDALQESHVTSKFKDLNEIFRAQFTLYKPLCKYHLHSAFAVNALNWTQLEMFLFKNVCRRQSPSVD